MEKSFFSHVDRIGRHLDQEMHRRVPGRETTPIGALASKSLMRLALIEPSSVQKLARHTGRDTSQMARTMRQLEHLGLVVRAPDPDDGRASLLTLSDAGRKYISEIEKIAEEISQDTLSVLTDAEQETVRAVLKKLSDTLDDL